MVLKVLLQPKHAWLVPLDGSAGVRGLSQQRSNFLEGQVETGKQGDSTVTGDTDQALDERHLVFRSFCYFISDH